MTSYSVTSLPALQNRIKRDPQAYLAEYLQQTRRFQAELHLLTLNVASHQQSKGTPIHTPHAQSNDIIQTGQKHKELATLITFLSHVAPCYAQGGQLATQLIEVLHRHAHVCDQHLRKSAAQALILLQNKQCVERVKVLPIFFNLFSVQDKQLRLLLFSHIVNDIKRLNRQSKSLKVNGTIQSFMYTLLKQDNNTIAKKALDVMIELWKRNIWTDEKTVNAIVIACFVQHTPIMVSAMRFFLGVPTYDEEKEGELDDDVAMNQTEVNKLVHSMKGMVKNKKKREKELERLSKRIKHDKDKKDAIFSSATRALQLVHDPQSFAERLYNQLRSSTQPFAVRMVMMNVISRLIGVHKLILLNFYPLLQKYMQPHQKNVTHILVYLAQASHSLVPPDILRPCIRTLADNFVTDRSSPEVTAVGLNAIREVCCRAPLCLEKDLLADLVKYKKHKNKGVMMAARSLLATFRELNPNLLHRRERGKFASADRINNELEYGADPVNNDVPGAELLLQTEQNGDAESLYDSDGNEIMELDPIADAELIREIEENNSDVDDVEDNTLHIEEKETMSQLAEDTLNDDLEAIDEAGSDDVDSGVSDHDENGNAVNDEHKEPSFKESTVAANELQHLESSNMEKQNDISKRLPFAATKIFSEEDFAKLKQLKYKAILERKNSGKKRKVNDIAPDEMDSDDLDEALNTQLGDVVEQDTIIGYRPKKRLTRDEKLEQIREGRGNNTQNEKKGGTTNRAKLKTKNFQMLKHSTKVRSKQINTTFSQKQSNAARHLRNLKNVNRRAQRSIKRKKL